jgi:hypothetical protein
MYKKVLVVVLVLGLFIAAAPIFACDNPQNHKEKYCKHGINKHWHNHWNIRCNDSNSNSDDNSNTNTNTNTNSNSNSNSNSNTVNVVNQVNVYNYQTVNVQVKNYAAAGGDPKTIKRGHDCGNENKTITPENSTIDPNSTNVPMQDTGLPFWLLFIGFLAIVIGVLRWKR